MPRSHHEELSLLGQLGLPVTLAAGVIGTAAGALILRIRNGGLRLK
jgi:hypothetical protein